MSSSTYTIQNTINALLPYVRYKPLTIGPENEPAMTIANTVVQTITGPPFAWNWNRKTASFTTTSGTQDYTVAISDFGFAELASVSDGTTTKEIEIRTTLGAGKADTARPESVSPQIDDMNGNITFRCLPVPDATYTMTVTYQSKPAFLASLNSAWGIPDNYLFIYNDGFLALSYLFQGDPRFQVINQRFISRLLGASEGLSEQARDIFLAQWQVNTSQAMSAGLRTQQGAQARGV